MEDFPNSIESIEDLNKNQIDALLSRAKDIKSGRFKPLNTESIVCTLFLEKSTRTKISFALAAKKLGCCFLDVDPETSALGKGEELLETLRTLKALGVNLCILRTPEKTFLPLQSEIPLKIINGGDGMGEHPCQALGDLFTMKETGFDLKNKCVVIVGDSIHSRVSHSLQKLLPLFGADIITTGPQSLTDSSLTLKEAVEKADLLYLLRVQRERHKNTDVAMDEYHRDWGLDLKKIQEWGKTGVPVFHPGPTNIGVEISRGLVNSPQYHGFLQVQHSIPLKTALMEYMLNEGA